LKTFECRQANRNDETDIYAVLKEAAPEIPVSLDTQEAQSRMVTEIVQCHRSGKSWVATDENGRIIGVALARPDFHEQGAISLRYIAVSKESRRSGISASLMEKLKANGAPITASVLHNNRSGMENRLVRIGFTKVKSDDNETQFRWVHPDSKQAETKV
jgi:N-acetylglutamate synthase-like GNAT family acetyltransferase